MTTAEEDEHPPEEAFDTGALAQLYGRPGRRKPVPLLLALGVPGDHRRFAQSGMDPRDQLSARTREHDGQAVVSAARGQPTPQRLSLRIRS